MPGSRLKRHAGSPAPKCRGRSSPGGHFDLFRGRQTCDHEDLEIGVPEQGFHAIRDALAGLEVYAIVDGRCVPVSEASLAESHQTWFRDPDSGTWRLDAIREPWDGDAWICRRDPRLRRPGSKVIAHTTDGIPYQRPEIALLSRRSTPARRIRRTSTPSSRCSSPMRRWLADALELAHPAHPWIEAARGGSQRSIATRLDGQRPSITQACTAARTPAGRARSRDGGNAPNRPAGRPSADRARS